MIEATIISYLTEKLGINVYAEVPKEIEYPFVVVTKTGGNEKNKIYHSMFAIKSYDVSLLKAAQLNERVIEAMDMLIENAQIGKVSLNSNYDNTDTANKRYRYQAVFDIYHY